MKNKIKKIFKKFPLLNFILSKFLIICYQMGSRKKWNSLLKNKSEIKLELGSGKKRGENGWTTIDITNADINWDLTNGIPLPNNSVSKIYSSHLLEHIPYTQLIIFLKECHRTLKPEGKFLVCVPNIRLYIDAYKKGQLFRDKDTWWQDGLIDTGSAIDQLNYMAYMNNEHKYMFDEENLIKTLIKSGFSNAKLREFNDEIDLKERDYESIYAVAFK